MKKIILLAAVFTLSGVANAEENKRAPITSPSSVKRPTVTEAQNSMKKPYTKNLDTDYEGMPPKELEPLDPEILKSLEDAAKLARELRVKRFEKEAKRIGDELDEKISAHKDVSKHDPRTNTDRIKMYQLQKDIEVLEAEQLELKGKIADLKEPQPDSLDPELYNFIFKPKGMGLGIKLKKNNSEKYISCERFLKKRGVKIEGDFFVQSNRNGNKIRTFSDKGFTEFGSDRQVCHFYDKPKKDMIMLTDGMKKMPKDRGFVYAMGERFGYRNAYNKESLLNEIFEGKEVSSPLSDAKFTGKECVKTLMGRLPKVKGDQIQHSESKSTPEPYSTPVHGAQ